MRKIAITTGEPAGIGPEICIKAALKSQDTIELIGSCDLLKETAVRLKAPWPLPANVSIRDVPLHTKVTSGVLTPANAPYVIEMLRIAATSALNGEYDALVTAPVQKSVLDTPAHPFSGHTEFFAQMSGVDHVVMMLVSSDKPNALRVALATTHLPIRMLSSAITADLLDRTITILNGDLIRSFGIASPRIAVTGLNPHAGESGHLGDEEIKTITPAIDRARSDGIDATGPWPADTIFVSTHVNGYDAILCMYHDQGLPVLKREGFGQGVNVTLGLPWVRTSVDHGTALDIAGKNLADEGSLLCAMRLARQISHNRSQHSHF